MSTTENGLASRVAGIIIAVGTIYVGCGIIIGCSFIAFAARKVLSVQKKSAPASAGSTP